MKAMEWPRLLSARRLGKTEDQPYDPARSPFQQDFDRIIFSTPFRRLQDKTQVFPLAANDFVRTRLTHSLEASCVGRSLGTQVGGWVCQRHGLEKFHASDFGAIVAAACAAHDIGNPPFGHSGEDVIRHWFGESKVARAVARKLTAPQRRDIERYEGNAQGFRLLARLQWPDRRGGLQLTCATLGAFTKYPVGSPAIAVQGAKGKRPVGRKKFGFFEADRELFAEVAAHTGLLPLPGKAGWVRHPLVYLVEAADDICYQLIDFEDGYRLGLIGYDEIRELFESILRETDRKIPAPPAALDTVERRRGRIGVLCATAIGGLVESVAHAFQREEKKILAGKLDHALTDLISAAPILRTITDISVDRIYRSQAVVEIEAAGFEVLSGLLDTFVGAAFAPAKRGSRAEKMLEVLPPGYRSPGAPPYARLLRILDFVSGMTDSYAVSLYKKIKGISLPGQ